MNFLIAPNALKGSLSASNAARIISKALHNIMPDARCVVCPISDGGNGTLECLVQATGGKFRTASVRGPLASMTVEARWGVLGDGTTAVIEMAEAAGLHLLKPGQYDVAGATTFGVGELIRHAVNSGYKKIVIGMGGSATNDGGTGCATALGVKFFDENEIELPEGGIHLSRLHHIKTKDEELRIKEKEIVALSDVTNILCGPEGTAFTYAAQKGATTEQIRQLDEALKHYASIIEGHLHRDVSHFPGSGAAGGLGAGLMAFCNAKIVSGIDYVLDMIRFDTLLQQCDCVITAEGTLDSQTLQGKGIDGIARRAKRFGKPVHAYAGKILGNKTILQRQLGLATVSQISPDGVPTAEAMKNAEAFLSNEIRNHFFTKTTKDTR
ncbi:MAG: glycerate kinase [Bacteroidota bacterium]